MLIVVWEKFPWKHWSSPQVFCGGDVQLQVKKLEKLIAKYFTDVYVIDHLVTSLQEPYDVKDVVGELP